MGRRSKRKRAVHEQGRSCGGRGFGSKLVCRKSESPAEHLHVQEDDFEIGEADYELIDQMSVGETLLVMSETGHSEIAHVIAALEEPILSLPINIDIGFCGDGEEFTPRRAQSARPVPEGHDGRGSSRRPRNPLAADSADVLADWRRRGSRGVGKRAQGQGHGSDQKGTRDVLGTGVRVRAG